MNLTQRMKSRMELCLSQYLFFLLIGLFQQTHGTPEVCLMPPDRGPCFQHFYLYYYSHEQGNCSLFPYGGCPGNSNRFYDYDTCMDVCTRNGTLEGPSTTSTTSTTGLSSTHLSQQTTELSYEERVRNAQEKYPPTPYIILDNGTGQSTFTFASPSSFIQIGPQEITGYQIRNRRSVSLEFRTRLPHALLVYHGIKDRPTKMNKYELYVMLDQGQLKIKHLFGDYSTTVVVGKGLNRDRWHRVDVEIDPHQMEILARVDNDENRKSIDGLKESRLYGAEHEDLESILFFGGLKAGETHMDISYVANPFVGCIRNVTLATSPLLSSELEPIMPLIASRFNNVDEDCVDKCWDLRVPCSRDSKCINHYDHVECDCFSARFKGDNCKDTDISILTLRGYSYVTFTVYEWMDRVHSDVNRISMHFKTFTDDSILFYAAGEIPYHSHVAASIKDRKVYVDINFGEGESIWTHIGNSLTDGHWHILTVEHHGKNLTIKLDHHEKRYEIPGNHHHLYIDPDIYVGGGGPILKNREGLNSSNNFVGCLKEVYFNEKSILFELREKKHQARHHGLTAPVFGSCEPQDTVPITIPFAESGFRVSNPNLEDLNLKFEFKPQELFGTLAYSDIRTIQGEGFWELKIVNDEVHFTLQPDKTIANISSPKALLAKFDRKGREWNKVELRYFNGEVSLKTDIKRVVQNVADLFQLSPIITLGTSVHKPSTGFVGCMRQIVIGGNYVDGRTIVGSEDQIGDIAMDNCQFVNPCTRPDVCEHGGKCGVLGGEISCECDGSGYIGKHCHFAVFKRTCEELALLGYTESGVYKIDIDGNGPYPPSHVKCKFETDFSGETKTVVEHNLANETDVWTPNDEETKDFKLELTYREFTPEMLMSLVSQSVQCHQHIKFDCYKSKLALHQYSWFKSADVKMKNVVSIGDAPMGMCPCSQTRTCAGIDEHCNCDAMDGRWLSDEGFYSLPERLGVTQMYFMVPKDLPKDAAARITLGPLECVEANTQRYVVTFKTFGSYLEAPGWKSGDLAFSFRTTRSSAILLYQPLLHSQDNSFSVYLTNDHELVFRFVLNGGAPQSVTVRSQRALSGGDWQQVWIDYDLHQVRFQINREHQMISLPDGQQFGPFEGTMYIAGAPAKNLEDTEIQDGLIGCFRGLVMNGQVLDLYSYMKFHKADIVKDCSPSCDPNPCKNKAQCQENWGSFTCQCINPYSQSGQFCEHDINVDGLTFLSQSSYIKKALINVDNSPMRNILTSNIYLNLRTYDTEALVLYANDNLNNFVQLHIQEGENMIFSWNYGETIHQLTVSPKKPLNRGESIQVAVDRNETHTTLHVNQDAASVPLPVNLLKSYSERPFVNSELEIFIPPRPYAPVSTYYQMFLAGYDNSALKHASNLTHIPGLLGCLRGLKIGQDRIILNGFANSNDVLDGCKMVCDSNPCHNGGLCIEDFQAREYSCDCTLSSYYGKRCDEERGANFQGESFIRRRFKVPVGGLNGIEARFGFSTTSDSYTEDHTVLLAVQIPGRKYSLLFSITKAGHFMVRENREGNGTYGTTIQYQNFVDGSRHSVYFHRSKDETLLMVDQEEIAISLNNTDEEIFAQIANAVVAEQQHFIGEIFVGGVNEAVPNLRNFQRFKGCMSNIFVQVQETEMRPVEEYMGFVKKEPDLVLDVEKVEGIKLGNCAAFSSFSLFPKPPVADDLSPHSGGSDWRTTMPEKLPLNLRVDQKIQPAAISFNTMALIFAIFFGIVIVFVAMYTYRLNKRYKQRILDDDDDDDLYPYRNPTVRYQETNNGNSQYGAYNRQSQSDKVELLNAANNQHSGIIGAGNPKSILNNSKLNNLTQTKEDELRQIDDENASSDTTSENASHQSSASSLSNTQILDDKGDVDVEGDETESADVKLMNENVNDQGANEQSPEDPTTNEGVQGVLAPLPSNSNVIMPPVYVSETVRTFERSPIAIIGGPRFGNLKRHTRSKDSIVSLD